MNVTREVEALLSVQGKPASSSLGAVVPSMFGQTILSLFKDRIVEETKRFKAGRYSELLLSELDSAEISFKGNSLWLVLGFLTIWLFGLGIVFIIVYFNSRQSFLIIRSKSNVQIVCTNGDDTPYRDFMKEVIKTAIGVKKQ